VNHFLKLAEQQISAPAQRLSAKADKAIAERKTAFRIWRKTRAERHEALMAGPHGSAFCELVGFLHDMTLDDGKALVSRAEQWRDADAGVRFEVLNLIDNAIASLRERSGLSPFDDSLPGAPPNVFLIVRGALT
jgi:hypothetical protein